MPNAQSVATCSNMIACLRFDNTTYEGVRLSRNVKIFSKKIKKSVQTVDNLFAGWYDIREVRNAEPRVATAMRAIFRR